MSSRHVLHALFDLIKKRLDGQVDVVWGIHSYFISFQVWIFDHGVCIVKMSEELEGGDVGKINVAVAHGSKEHAINCSN